MDKMSEQRQRNKKAREESYRWSHFNREHDCETVSIPEGKRRKVDRELDVSDDEEFEQDEQEIRDEGDIRLRLWRTILLNYKFLY
jgi:hypothetical protein